MNPKKQIKEAFKHIAVFIKKINLERKNILKDIKNISFILLGSFLFLIIWVNRVNLAPENIIIWVQDSLACTGMGGGFPYSPEGEKISAANFMFNSGRIIALSDNSLNIVNGSGKVVRSQKHSLSNPSVKTNNVRTIMFDRGGKNYSIETFSKNLYKGAAEQAIIAGAVSDSGTYGIVTQSPCYLAELAVYNKQNAEKYRYSFSNHYISDIAMNSEGSEAAVCGISTENGNINSNVYLLNFKSEQPKSQFKLNDNMVTAIYYISQNKIVAVGDKYMSFINLKSKSVNNFYYDGKILKSYDIITNDGVCCCLSSSVKQANGDEIIDVDINGKEYLKISSGENIKSISCQKNRIVALTSNKIISYNSAGVCEGHKKISHNFKKIILAPHSYVYALGCSNIHKIKLSGLEKD